MRVWCCAVLLLILPIVCSAADTALPAGPEGAAPASYAGAGEPPEGGDLALNLRPHEPMYFSAGWRGTSNAKFQVSFKYQLAEHLFFGYTQTSVWDFGAQSAPFYDSSYRPSFFYATKNDGAGRLGGAHTGWQAGVEHESNGKSGAESRSINIAFIRPVFVINRTGNWRFRAAPKVWAYIDKSENTRIDDYRGYADVLLVYDIFKGFGVLDGLQISANLRKGTEKHYGSIQVDLSYPLGSVIYAHLQYFSGWGETILDYDQRFLSQVRLGVMVVRW